MTAASRICAACETELPENAKYCFRCGASTNGASEDETDSVELRRVRTALGERYSVIGVVGTGAMATVYRARDEKHRRDVAVKVLRTELTATIAAERFLREIELAAQLNHPHILTIHDSGFTKPVLYYVMPLVDGETLEARLQRDTRLPFEEALRLAREIADALAYAHGRGVVHRDIKPANILLQAGHALVADFGLGRALASSAASLTGTGLSVGTPMYMSPEQALGKPDVDGRTDVYAVGAILYEMLTGQPPFVGLTPYAVMAKVMNDAPPPLSQFVSDVPSVMQRVVDRALAKKPEARYQTGNELAEALILVDMNVLTEGVRGMLESKDHEAVSDEETQGSQTRTAALFGVSAAAVLAVIYAVMQQLGLAPWVFAVAVAPIALGLPLYHWTTGNRDKTTRSD